MRIGKTNTSNFDKKDVIYFGLLFCCVILFFIPLFIPQIRIFTTPDSNLSDILHFNYPLKQLLSEALKHKTLPLWTDLIGTGFPLIGEGEIAAFSLVNILLFSLFQTPVAYNLGYIITFTMFAWGMYLVGKELRWNAFIAFFVAFWYAFNGFHIVQIPHYGHLQVLSYMPFLVWVILRMSTSPKSKLWIILPFLINQQILQGHYQYVFITWVFLLLFWGMYLRKTIVHKGTFYKEILLSVIIGILLSAIQLIPSFEFFSLSERSNIVSIHQQIKSGGFSIVHLLQFIYPYVFGDVRKGTFPTNFYISFWEIFSYIGILPLCIGLYSLVKLKTSSFLKSNWIIVLILLLLCIEVNSPLYLLFYFPPLSWFRIHSRFLSALTFTLLLIVGWTIHQIYKAWKYKKKTLIILIVCLLTSVDIMVFASTYHPIQSPTVLTKPKLFPDTPIQGRITAIGTTQMWFSYMYKYGWTNPNAFLFLLNGGTPNNNILFNQPSIQVYSGFSLKKQTQLYSLAVQVKLDTDEKIASLSASAITTLRLHNTPYILTPYVITNDEVEQDNMIESPDNKLPAIRRYRLSAVKPQYYFSYHPIVVKTLEQYIELLKDKNILQTYDAFIHKPFQNPKQSNNEINPKSNIEITNITSTRKTFLLSTNRPTLFIASVYFYPGWEAYLDGHKIPIYPANLSGMGMPIPEGTHTLDLIYIPYSLYWGSIGTILGICLYGFIAIQTMKKKLFNRNPT